MIAKAQKSGATFRALLHNNKLLIKKIIILTIYNMGAWFGESQCRWAVL
jgi:hypothetical protein